MNIQRPRKQLIPLLSLIVLGLSGLGINILIGRYYNVQVLGHFNSALAFYLVSAQIGSLGTYMTILHFFSQPIEKLHPQMVLSVSLTTTVMALIGSLSIVFLAFVLYNLFPNILGSDPETAKTILAASLGIPFFCLNKNLLAFLNAQNHINIYFLLQGFRYLLLLGILLVMALIGFSSVWLGHVFWMCESVLLIVSSITIIFLSRKYFKSIREENRISLYWRERSSVTHSLKALLGGTVLELAVRVDIFMLTYFVDSFYVGIYSVAAMAAEGLNQITGLARDQLSPQIGRLHLEQKKTELKQLIKSTAYHGYILLLLPAMLAILLFPGVTVWLFSNTELSTAGLPFTILMIGLYLSAPYHILFYSPNQMGSPITLTVIVVISTVFNVLLNLLFIPHLGIAGAATATSLSWITALALLGGWLRKQLV
jgi:O-antigen/teichoic acid export membrane protein